MRPGPNAKRSRGRGNGGPGGGNNMGGGRRQNVPLRLQTLDSSGPTGKLRGNAYQLHEKYLGLARDAYSSGDRVAAENYFQHAEHYYRIINSTGGSTSRHDFDAFEGADGEQPEVPHSYHPNGGQGQGHNHGPHNGGNHQGQGHANQTHAAGPNGGSPAQGGNQPQPDNGSGDGSDRQPY